MEASQKVLQNLKQLKAKVGRYEALHSAWEDALTLCELAIEENDDSLLDEVSTAFNSVSEEIETLRLETLLSGKYDANNAIISIHPGAGGTEAQDWAEMLLRMYQHWGERRGFAVETLD